MRKAMIFILVFCTTCTSAVYGQSKKQSPEKVAVYVISSKTGGLGEFVGAYLVDAITHNSGYVAVERTTEFLKALNSEHEYQHSGMVDDEQIAKLGKQFGTKLIFVVKTGKVAGKQFVQARLLDVETATVKNSTKPITFSMEDVEDVCVSVVTQLLTESKDTRTIPNAFGKQ